MALKDSQIDLYFKKKKQLTNHPCMAFLIELHGSMPVLWFYTDETVFTQNNEKMHVRKPSDCCFTPNQQFLCYGAVIIVVIVWLDKNDIMDLFEVLNHYLISLRFSTEFVFF